MVVSKLERADEEVVGVGGPTAREEGVEMPLALVDGVAGTGRADVVDCCCRERSCVEVDAELTAVEEESRYDEDRDGVAGKLKVLRLWW